MPFWIIQYWIHWKLRRQYCLQSNLISLHISFQYFVMYSKYFKFLCIFIMHLVIQLTYFLFSILFFILTPTCIFHPHFIIPKLTFTLNNCFFIVSLHFLYCSKVKFVSKLLCDSFQSLNMSTLKYPLKPNHHTINS